VEEEGENALAKPRPGETKRRASVMWPPATGRCAIISPSETMTA